MGEKQTRYWPVSPVRETFYADESSFKRCGGSTRQIGRPNSKQTKEEKMITPPLDNKSLKQKPIPFAFTAPAARQVILAGDFNHWDPKATPMRKGADGVWRLSVALKPGRHEYRFIADGVWQDDPSAQQRTPNAMGSENCVKTVSG